MTVGEDIQLENGNWSRVHNAIWRELGKAPLTGRQFRCLMVLFGKTYGFQKKEDKISLSQWEAETGIERHNVWRELQYLIRCRVIYMQSNGPKRPVTWGFNKYVEQWTFDSVVKNDNTSIVADDYSSNNSVVIYDNSSNANCSHGQLQSVVTLHESTKERKKAEAEAEKSPAAAAISESPPTPPIDPLLSAFVEDYQHIWGMMISSPFVRDEVLEWTHRVTRDGWRYALKESTNHNARKWSYLRPILERVERDGAPPSAHISSTNATTFAYEEVNL